MALALTPFTALCGFRPLPEIAAALRGVPELAALIPERILSTFLCCVVVVIRPFSHLGGTYAFLVLALKELVFSVQYSLAQQLELTVLNILGAVFIALRKDIIWTVGAMWISMSIWRAPPKAAPVSVSQGPRIQFKCLQLELTKLCR